MLHVGKDWGHLYCHSMSREKSHWDRIRQTFSWRLVFKTFATSQLNNPAIICKYIFSADLCWIKFLFPQKLNRWSAQHSGVRRTYNIMWGSEKFFQLLTFFWRDQGPDDAKCWLSREDWVSGCCFYIFLAIGPTPLTSCKSRRDFLPGYRTRGIVARVCLRSVRVCSLSDALIFSYDRAAIKVLHQTLDVGYHFAKSDQIQRNWDSCVPSLSIRTEFQWDSIDGNLVMPAQTPSFSQIIFSECVPLLA